MDVDAVAKLAIHENDRWRTGAAAVPSPGLGAYLPLDGRAPETGDPEPQVEYVDATAVGTVLIIRFRWPRDDRDLLLPIDFRGYPHGVEGAGTWLLEYLRQHVEHDMSWHPRDVVPVSPHAALVRPSRQPTAAAP